MGRLKKCVLLVVSLLLFLAFLAVGPFDLFTHGFYCSEIDVEKIGAGGGTSEIDLADGEYEMTFSPANKHMAGFEIYLTNQPEGNTGELLLKISDSEKTLETVSVDLSKVKGNSWYKVYTSARLKEGKQYKLKFSTQNCHTIPHLQRVDKDYLLKETIEGDVMLCYAYARSTFTKQNKAIFFLYFLALECGIFALIFGKRKKLLGIAALGIFLTAVLTWNYMYNTMDNSNGWFASFQADSESFVWGPIYAEEDGVTVEQEDEDYGLGGYNKVNANYLSNENWENGYSKTDSAILVNLNKYSAEVAVTGNYIVFENGETFRITEIEDDGGNRIIKLGSDKILNSYKYGSLDKAYFLNQDKQPLERGKLSAYRSQYGLQGKVFKFISRYFSGGMNLLCAVGTAAVFVVIVFLIAAHYNKLLAGIFFVTFWLSPWIVNFARNLYWVEFTWFIPMAIGLLCAWRIDNKVCRRICDVAALAAVFVKCLCGYEYITTIMMGLISFMLADFFVAIANKDKRMRRLLFRTIIIIGCCAIMGFVFALVIHANLRGNGNISLGIKSIYEQDVLRRTGGGDLNVMNTVYWDSLNASVWETVCKYFHSGTEIITGITGNLFPLLCTVPLIVFAHDYKNSTLNVGQVAMYGVFFLTSISWFVLGKAHSYIHGGMNYVMWYFGFVQTCFYIIVDKFVRMFGKRENPRMNRGESLIS